MSSKTANGGTSTKTGKTAAATSRKRSQPASVKRSTAGGGEPRTGTAGIKRKKPFVL